MAILALAAFAASAEAKHRKSGGVTSDVGGAQAPAAGATGTTGTTGITGSTGVSGDTGTSGDTGSTLPVGVSLAPITLPKGVSPTTVYTGPVFEETAAGLVPYTVSSTSPSAPSSVAGGTTAAASSVSQSALPELVVPGDSAEEVKVGGLGLAAAPEDAPVAVQEIIWAANRIIGRPYVYGGGHRSFKSFGYDCSGTVSYALHGADLLSAPLDSGQFERWGASGQGEWMTILTNPGHAYLDIAGLRLDTSPADDPSGLEGPRWRPLRPGNSGYVERHPFGY